MGEEELAMTVHPTAIVSKKTKIGKGTRIWAFAQIREDVVIGSNCVIGNGVYIDRGVRVGDRVNIHNKALLYRNLSVEDDAFIGPGVCFTNDPSPRANRIRNLRGARWFVRKGASIGANSTILPGVTIGRYAMVGAGSVVTRSIPAYALAVGVPAKVVGTVSADGRCIRTHEKD